MDHQSVNPDYINLLWFGSSNTDESSRLRSRSLLVMPF